MCGCRDTDLSEMDIPQFFVVERDKFGKLLHKELKPGGQDEMVTNDNKEEYVRQALSLGFVCGQLTSLSSSSSAADCTSS